MSWPGGAVAEHKHVLTNYSPTVSSRIVVRVTHSPDGMVCFVVKTFYKYKNINLD